MQDYKVQRCHFFSRKSLNFKLLEIGRVGESVAVYAFMLWAAASSRVMDKLELQDWSVRLLSFCKPFLSSLGFFLGCLWSFWSSFQYLWYLATLLNLQLVTSVTSNVISWITSSLLRWSLLWLGNTYCKLITYPAQMDHSYFSMTVDCSVPKLEFRGKMFEKVICYFSFSNLECCSELTYNEIIF